MKRAPRRRVRRGDQIHAAASAPHPLRRYRPYVNMFDGALECLTSLMGVPSFETRVRQVGATL